MIQISKEKLYEMALGTIMDEVNSIYGHIDESNSNIWLIDSLATIRGIANFTMRIVKEGEVKENE